MPVGLTEGGPIPAWTHRKEEPFHRFAWFQISRAGAVQIVCQIVCVLSGDRWRLNVDEESRVRDPLFPVHISPLLMA